MISTTKFVSCPPVKLILILFPHEFLFVRFLDEQEPRAPDFVDEMSLSSAGKMYFNVI